MIRWRQGENGFADGPAPQAEMPLSPMWHDADTGRLRRFALAAVITPVLFIAVMALAGRRFADDVWPGHAPLLIDILTAAAATAFGVTMVIFVRRERRRLLDQTRFAATVAERERIARELHDSLAQVLGTVHLRLRALSAHPHVADSSTVVDEVDGLAELCHDAYRDVREAIVGLRETPTAGLGLVTSLERYVATYSRQAGLPALLETNLSRDPALSPHSEVQVIRVVQEALTNVRKHADATQVVVRVTERGDDVTVEIEDDGRGFDAYGAGGAADGLGFGLRCMRERAVLAGGRLSVDSGPGRGTRVSMALPRARTGQLTAVLP